MMSKPLLICLTAVTLTLSTAAAKAEDSKVLELERTLNERDQVILELLERVEALERRVGVERLATDSAAARRQQEVAPTTEHEREQDPAAAPGRVVVDAGAAERALERALTVEGVLLLPRGVLDFEPTLSHRRQEDTAPSFVTSGGEIFAGEMERNVNSLTADMALRLGLPWDSQLEIGIPYRWRKVDSVTQIGFVPTSTSSQSDSGWGDARLGLAKTLLRERRWRPDIVARLTWDTDTGENIGFGDSFQQLRGSLTAIKRQDPIVFVAGTSYEHVFEKEQLQPGAAVAVNFGGFIALSPETSLSLSFSGAYQDETELAGHNIDGSDRTYGSVFLGGSTLLAPGILLNLSAGIGLTDDADDFSLTLSVPVRFSGRLF